MLTDLKLRPRENMPTLLLDNDVIIGTVKLPEYENLLVNAGLLKEQLSLAVFIIDLLPGVSIDTRGMKRVLEATKTGDE